MALLAGCGSLNGIQQPVKIVKVELWLEIMPGEGVLVWGRRNEAVSSTHVLAWAPSQLLPILLPEVVIIEYEKYSRTMIFGR